MASVSTKNSVWIRGFGILLIAAGGALLMLFVESPVGTLARYGFPQAWKGGPLLLGCAFCLINGFFLLIQRRFSLGAFLVAGILSAALTSGAHAYVMSIRETTTTENQFGIPRDKLKEFITESRECANADYLSAIVKDAFASGWLRGGLDFDTVAVSYGADAKNKDLVLVSLTFEYSPYVHVDTNESRAIVQSYSEIVHSIVADRLRPPPLDAQYFKWDTSNKVGELVGRLVDSQRIMMSQPGMTTTTYYAAYAKAQTSTLQWLFERETNLKVKRLFKQIIDEQTPGR